MSIIGRVLVNLIVVLAVAPLFDGVMRKLKAIIHSRQGPPITQTYIDLFKLLGKEDLQSGGGPIFRLAPIMVLGAMLMAALFTPLGGKPPLGVAGDTIVWIYVISLAAVAIMLGAFASGNPYAYEGASREMMMLLTVEPIVIAALLTAAVKAGTLSIGGIMAWQVTNGPTMSMALATIAFFLALQANLGRLPFDIVEAESEIMEGPIIEYSGPRLAMYKMAFYVRQLIFPLVLVSVFIPWPIVNLYPLAVLVTLAKVLVVLLIVGLIECVNPRLRIDQSMTYMSRVLFVALASLVFAVIGV